MNNFYVHIPVAQKGIMITYSGNGGGALCVYGGSKGSGINVECQVVNEEYKISTNPRGAISQIMVFSFNPIDGIYGTDS